MKVCFVIPTLTSGGAERVAVTVLSALDATRYERTLYVFSRADGVYFDHIGSGVRVVVATQQSWFRRLFELAAFLRSTRPDIVMPFLSYFITALAVMFSGTAAKLVFNQGTPTTAFLEDPDFSWRAPLRRGMFALLTRLFYARADAVVVTSRGVGDDLVANYGVAPDRIRVLHNPVDLDAIAAMVKDDPGVSRSGPVIVAAGRLAGVKNYPLLLAAVARLKGSLNVQAWILGEGSERAALEDTARREGIADLVTFFGFQKNPFQYIARADAFVLTSSYEGFGNVLIEAMACGTPVVATRSPGTEEIIGSGDNGLLVAHQPDAVASAIATVLGDPALRGRLVSRARVTVKLYALPIVAQRYDQLFQELAA